MDTLGLEHAEPAIVTTWTIDPIHSTVGFSIKHLMVATVHGRFEGFSGAIRFVGRRPSMVVAEIDAASIDTGVNKRDNHLRSADFLDVESYPTIRFRSETFHLVSKHGRTGWIVTGELTIHGVTRPVELEVEQIGSQDPDTAEILEFGATARIKRSEYGMTFSLPIDGGGLVVADEVTIAIGVKASKLT